MLLNESMLNTVDHIRDIEPRKFTRRLDVPVGELGNRLIEIYYATDKKQTRELIIDFMREAGVVWQRKLLLKDSAPIASTTNRLASLKDYVALLAANDQPYFPSSGAAANHDDIALAI